MPRKGRRSSGSRPSAAAPTTGGTMKASGGGGMHGSVEFVELVELSPGSQ